MSAKSRWGPLGLPHGRIGLALLLIGQILILVRLRPLSDFYFPFAWLGYALFLDAALAAHCGQSLYQSARRVFLVLFPISAVFWWLFELLNLAVKNWTYLGSPYTGLTFVVFASIDFSLVLVAVWSSARLVHSLLPHRKAPPHRIQVPERVLQIMVASGIISLILTVLFPRYFFGLTWISLFLLLDPINEYLGRPSMIRAAINRHWYLPLSFALGALMCGFFWEAWNFWASPKWVYNIPYVGFWHIFEMPLLGWSGYLPFGLELFAMTNFVLPFFGFGPLGLEEQSASSSHTDESRLDVKTG